MCKEFKFIEQDQWYCRECDEHFPIRQDGKCPFCGSENIEDNFPHLLQWGSEEEEVWKAKKIREGEVWIEKWFSHIDRTGHEHSTALSVIVSKEKVQVKISGWIDIKITDLDELRMVIMEARLYHD